MLKGNTNLINDELSIYRSITREDIKRVANELLNAKNRVDMDYLKAKSE
jgi:(2Fe-2S) ferredoxin